MKLLVFFPSKEDFLIFAENVKVFGMHSCFRKPICGQLPLAVVRISYMIGIPPDYFIGFRIKIIQVLGTPKVGKSQSERSNNGGDRDCRDLDRHRSPLLGANILWVGLTPPLFVTFSEPPVGRQYIMGGTYSPAVSTVFRSFQLHIGVINCRKVS
jgi:hypothetical protein